MIPTERVTVAAAVVFVVGVDVAPPSWRREPEARHFHRMSSEKLMKLSMTK